MGPFFLTLPANILNMARYLAIDYGTRRTGIAVTDPLKMIATPLKTVGTHDLMGYISEYMSNEPVERLIVGRPVQMDNSPSESMKYVKQFVQAFKKRFPLVRVEWMDERFTSKMAADAMIEGGMKKRDRQRKEHLDRISAVIILQSYLEHQNNMN
jgi:putative Holliday junction resolvase